MSSTRNPNATEALSPYGGTLSGPYSSSMLPLGIANMANPSISTAGGWSPSVSTASLRQAERSPVVMECHVMPWTFIYLSLCRVAFLVVRSGGSQPLSWSQDPVSHQADAL